MDHLRNGMLGRGQVILLARHRTNVFVLPRPRFLAYCGGDCRDTVALVAMLPMKHEIE
jgi:hypothetical protein